MNPSRVTLQPEAIRMEWMSLEKLVCYNLVLAPFQPSTRIELETNVNSSVECCLNIKNIGPKALNVTVTKLPCAERHIILSLSELEIQGNSSSTIYIKWSPKEAGCWRDVLQLTDSRRIKYDIIIATTAKSDKKTNKTGKKLLRPPIPKSSNLSMPLAKKPLRQNNASLKIPNVPISKPPSVNLTQSRSLAVNDAQVKQHKSKCNIDLNKENVWKDGSILPQNLVPLNGPQDIRRATYVKETRPTGSSMLYEHIEEVPEESACIKYDQSDMSVMLDKFTFTHSVDAVSNFSQSSKSTSLQDSGKHRTFNISGCQFLETSAASDARTCANRSHPASRPAGVYNLSPIKLEAHSLITDDCELLVTNDLIASSPIFKLQYSKEHNANNECLNNECFESDASHDVQKPDCEYFSFEVIPENIEAAKRAGDVYIEISPPKKDLHSKRNARAGKISKTSCKEKSMMKLQLNQSTAKKNTKNVAAIKMSKLNLSALSKTKWHAPSSPRESSFRQQSKEESFFYEAFELDPFAPSTTEDPFLKNTVHYDEQWLLQQELAFTKWLNALLSSPEDLSVDIETAVADIGKIWQLCKTQKDTVLAETKEAVSARYHTNIRLNTLRKAASAMFNRNEVTNVLSCTNTCISKGTLCIRSDRNLHRDIGLQKLILGLFLSYNPLWLRIGLETIYRENIPLRSNNDVVGLTRFLLARFFSDPRLTKMPGYNKTVPSQKFVAQLNQFILKKFFYLVYFLDYAKQQKLIGHDPCLFHKRAPYKESREILLSFSREVLSGIGDVTRVLRGHDYVLSYRQTYIEEYDYAVVSIRQDLRDGVRLCRAMELITGARGLTQRCRAPAISRLQKVYNAEMALNALRQAGYVLQGDVDAKSIVDGHCEKTLSLLWQIIHKYQAPRFDRSSRVLQRWWRARLWYVRVRNFLRERRNLAAFVIQRMWRRKTQSCRVAETCCDTQERRWFLRARTATVCLQRWWRSVREAKKLEESKKKRRAAITLQRRWRAFSLMRAQRHRYRSLKNAALTIQARWRATRAMRAQRSRHVACKQAALKIQLWWRRASIMREQRERFLRCRESARVIQAWWRRHLLARRARRDFLLAKTAVRTVERWWTSVLDRKRFLLCCRNAILIQRTWRQHRARKREAACVKIQAWWRAAVHSRRYKLRKSNCVKLQRWWRGIRLVKRERAEFQQLRSAALVVQKNWRARITRRHYLKQQRSAQLIQSRYRSVKSARIVRRRYLETRGAATRVQNWWRGVTAARQQRSRYLQLRRSVVLLQNHWRRRALTRADRQRYLAKRRACVTLQSWWRMVRCRNAYRRCRSCALIVQRRWRATRAVCEARRELLLTRAAVVVQTRWRALTARRRFLAERRAATILQSCCRMWSAMRKYETVKCAALTVQMHWRAYIVGRRERQQYLSLREAAITLQRRYRRRRIEREEELRRRQQDDFTSIVMKIRDECKKEMEMSQDTAAKLAHPDSDYWQEKINVLRNCSSIGALLICLGNLDIITRLSPTTCIIMCEQNLTDDIYNTIMQHNRSLPWMKVCLCACNILITLAKHPYTKEYVIKHNYALPLVKLLSCSLKDKEMFLHCATLIWLLCHDEDYSKTVATCPQISWLMKSVQQKVLKDGTVAKLQKSMNLEYPDCEHDAQKPRLFTDMGVAVAAIVIRTGT